MIDITEKEFKQVDLEFRQRASRLCRAKLQEVKMLLSKFLNYIEHTPVLLEYIQGCSPNMSDEAIAEMVGAVIDGMGTVSFDFGNDIREEIARQYRMLQIIDGEENIDVILRIGMSIDNSTHLQANVEGFIHAVVSPFVDNLTLFLHSVAMEVCASPGKDITLNISGDHAQVNVSQDQSTLTATQNNGAVGWEEIEAELQKYLVPKEGIDELKELLSREKPASKDNLGKPINQWIAKVVSWAAQGLVNLPMSAASGILAALVCKYYGWG